MVVYSVEHWAALRAGLSAAWKVARWVALLVENLEQSSAAQLGAKTAARMGPMKVAYSAASSVAPKVVPMAEWRAGPTADWKAEH